MKPMRLRDVATVRLSNVDKVTNASETAVRLCNYVDVYNNDFITGDIDFNTGSATKAEIDRFRLRIGDVVITKDSEERKDIGVPAFVRQTSADLVCGYHLAILRPDPKRIRGDFLFWALQAQGAQDEFSNCAKGVTRFGLSLDGIKSIPMRCPDLGVQKQIAAFLDRETGRIDKLITKRERFDSLVEERKSTLTIRAVNGAILGLAPNGRSGWFDAVPKSWDVRRARFLFRESAHRSTTGQEHLLSVSHLTGVTLRSEKNVNMFLAESTEGYKLVHAGDVVVNTMWAWMGAMGVSQLDGLISPSYGVYRPTGNQYLPEYLDLLLRSRPFVAEVNRRSKGVWSSRLRLYPDAFLGISFPIPSVDDQGRILSALADATKREDRLAELSARSIKRLREFRVTLITAAITGQIDVSSWKKGGDTDRRLDKIEKEISSSSFEGMEVGI